MDRKTAGSCNDSNFSGAVSKVQLPFIFRIPNFRLLPTAIRVYLVQNLATSSMHPVPLLQLPLSRHYSSRCSPSHHPVPFLTQSLVEHQRFGHSLTRPSLLTVTYEEKPRQQTIQTAWAKVASSCFHRSRKHVSEPNSLVQAPVQTPGSHDLIESNCLCAFGCCLCKMWMSALCLPSKRNTIFLSCLALV